jgi:hypothetical protein
VVLAAAMSAVMFTSSYALALLTPFTDALRAMAVLKAMCVGEDGPFRLMPIPLFTLLEENNMNPSI